MKKYTDTELLDYLQYLTSQKKYTGRVVLRNSMTGRGWRLHETSGNDGIRDVRMAIENYMQQNDMREIK